MPVYHLPAKHAGAVDIDADRDPSADRADFDPTVLTAQETADAALRAGTIRVLVTPLGYPRGIVAAELAE